MMSEMLFPAPRWFVTGAVNVRSALLELLLSVDMKEPAFQLLVAGFGVIDCLIINGECGIFDDRRGPCIDVSKFCFFTIIRFFAP